MPHIIIEYNPVVETRHKMPDLVQSLHEAAMAYADLPTGGIRTRAYCSDEGHVGDGHTANGFIYITIRLGQGRSAAVKKDIGDTLFKVLAGFSEKDFESERPLSIGLEIQEIEKNWTWKKNNIHQMIKDKNNG